MALEPHAPLGAHRATAQSGGPPVLALVPTGANRGVGPDRPGVSIGFAHEREDESTCDFAQQLSPSTLSRVALGLYHSLAVALKRDELLPQLFVWGRNSSNVLGLDISCRERAFPAQVPFFARKHVYQVACGANHSLVLLIDEAATVKKRRRSAAAGGKVFAFGLGNRGRLGFHKRGGSNASSSSSSQKQQQEGGADTAAAALLRDKEGEAELSDDSSTWFTPRPVRIRFPLRKTRILRITCGADHSLAISEKGLLFAWGVGAYGALGQGDTRDVYTPALVQFPSHSSTSSEKVQIVGCAAGARHSLACDKDGALWAWGHGSQGRLGLGHSRGSLQPARVEHMESTAVVYVSAGDVHSACIDRQGRLYTWGDGSYGRLGHGSNGELPLPRRVEGFGGLSVLQVACGTFHSLALTCSTAAVYAWGAGLGLGLGDALADSIVGTPQKVTSIEAPVLQVAVGPYHSAAVTIDGDLLVWGVSAGARLGLGDDRHDQAFPKFVAELRSRMFVRDLRVLMGAQQPLAAIDDEARLAGADVEAEATTATAQSSTLQQLSCGNNHAAALTASGVLWVWGSNDLGQLGFGSDFDEVAYEPLEMKKFTTPIRCIACGGNHSLAIGEYGDVFSWGSNDKGQLGIGVLRSAYTPEGVPGLRLAVGVYAGEDFSACITQSSTGSKARRSSPTYGEGRHPGDLYMWGSADGGKLGLGEDFTAGAVLSPQRVEALPLPITTCALGSSHTLAIALSGACYSWGAGFCGRLGTGGVANAYVPVRVKFPRSVRLKAVAAGAFHSMAISLQGDLWIWGRKSELCSTEDFHSPRIFMQLESPNGVPRITSIAASTLHSLAVTVDGVAFAWGNNADFQSGCGKKAAARLDRPEMISFPYSPVSWVATGPHASFFVLQNEEVFAAGLMKGGRLGIGWNKRMHQSEPAAIKAHWRDFVTAAAPDVAASIITTTNNSPEPPTHGRTDLPVAEVEGFLQRLAFSWDDSGASGDRVGWRDLQQLLQQEETENKAEYIEQLEDDIIAVSGRELDYVLTLDDEEKPFATLQAQFQAKLLKLATETRFDFPSTNVKKTLPLLSSKLVELQDLVWCLQQQPSYFLRLLGAVKRRWQLEAVVELATQIYYEIENARVIHLFSALLRALAAQEVERASSVFTCFDPEDSAVMRLFRAYATRTEILEPLARILLDLRNRQSFASALAASEATTFALSPEELAQVQGLSTSSLLGGASDILRQSFHEGLEAMKRVLTLLLFGQLFVKFPLPPVLRSLLLHARRAVISRNFPIDHQWMMYGGPVFYYSIPLIKLLLHGLLQPVFEDALLFASCTACPALPASVVAKFEVCARFIAFCSRPAGTNAADDALSSALLLRSIGVEMWSAVARALQFQTDVPDTLDIDLTMDIFEASFDLREHIVTLRGETICSIVNICQAYEAFLNMSAHDPVAALVRSIGEGRIPPYSEEQLASCRQHPTWHSFTMNHRFLLKEKNVVFDPITHCPVPQRMAYKQQALLKDRHRVVSLILRYNAPASSDSRTILQTALRELPAVSASIAWSRLAGELQALSEHFSACNPPDFHRGRLAANAAKAARDFAQSRTDPRAVMQWIGAGILERKDHRMYLAHVLRRQDGLAAMRVAYEARMKEQLAGIKAATEALEFLRYPSNIVEQAKREGFYLWFYKLRIKKKKAGKAGPGATGKKRGAQAFCPTATFKYSVLYRREVVKEVSDSIPVEIYSSLYLTFCLRKDQSWQVLLTQREGKIDRQVGEMLLQPEELLAMRQLPPQARYGILKSAENPHGFIVVQVLPFLQLLEEINAAATD